MSSALQRPTDPEVPIEVTPAENLRVLMIDDDPAYRHLCQRYLSKKHRVDYEVTVVPTASLGISQCQSQTFDCLLIDYTLPDISGTQLCGRLRDIFNESTPPVIILTADGGEAAAAEALRAGATDFLPKNGVSAESLAHAIDNAVEKHKLKSAVEVRSRELQRANEQLRSKNDQIQRFYHGVSHEVKTPLAATREFIAIVFDGIAGPVTEEQKKMLTHALDSCDQIAGHFNDLIEMTRLDTAKITMKKKVGSIDNVILRSLAAVAAAAEAKNIALKKTIESPIPLVRIDCNRVIQVLSNLLSNAIKYTEMYGTITLSVTHAGDEGFIQIAVADTGCGIADADLPYVFDRLYQVDSSGDELMGAGLGLGLSIAKEIVGLHGGDIRVKSVFGEGSTFTFRLPVARSLFDNTEKEI